MGEFASKGVAGSGLGLGIAGTALGVLSASQNGGGLLGGLFGGGMNQYAQGAAQAVLAEKDATIARLQAEKYSDKNDVEVYAQTRRENGELGDRLLGNWIQPLAKEAAANRERIAVLETEMKCDREKAALREQIVTDKIECVSREAAHGIQNVGMGLAALRQTVDGITRTIIPQTAICPPVMPRYNTWEAPTDTAPAIQPVNGTINVAK